MDNQNVMECSPHILTFIQSRAEIDFSTVDEYAQMMLDGIVFDPVEGVQDEKGTIWVWDGYHRGEAAKKAEMTLLVNLRPGTKVEAEWLALTANQKHGLRRTTADKQRIVRNALLHPYGMHLSNREIARHCGVSDKTVGRIRSEMETTAEIPQLDQRVVKKTDGTTYKIDTSNIGGRSPHQEKTEPDEITVPTTSSEPAYTDQEVPGSVEPHWPNNGHKPEPSARYETTAQEFECPRCGQEKIVGVNGSRRWCLACDAEWSTAKEFLAEVNTRRERQYSNGPTRAELQSRFASLLARLEDEQLVELAAWLDEVESNLGGAEEEPELLCEPPVLMN